MPMLWHTQAGRHSYGFRPAPLLAAWFFPNKNSFRKGVSYPTGIKKIWVG
eukprot:COSAG01_NODE_5345_length_4320_cov_64.852168_6_plen_50_part_00